MSAGGHINRPLSRTITYLPLSIGHIITYQNISSANPAVTPSLPFGDGGAAPLQKRETKAPAIRRRRRQRRCPTPGVSQGISILPRPHGRVLSVNNRRNTKTIESERRK